MGFSMISNEKIIFIVDLLASIFSCFFIYFWIKSVFEFDLYVKYFSYYLFVISVFSISVAVVGRVIFSIYEGRVGFKITNGYVRRVINNISFKNSDSLSRVIFVYYIIFGYFCCLSSVSAVFYVYLKRR